MVHKPCIANNIQETQTQELVMKYNKEPQTLKQKIIMSDKEVHTDDNDSESSFFLTTQRCSTTLDCQITENF